MAEGGGATGWSIAQLFVGLCIQPPVVGIKADHWPYKIIKRVDRFVEKLYRNLKPRSLFFQVSYVSGRVFP